MVSLRQISLPEAISLYLPFLQGFLDPVKVNHVYWEKSVTSCLLAGKKPRFFALSVQDKTFPLYETSDIFTEGYCCLVHPLELYCYDIAREYMDGLSKDIQLSATPISFPLIHKPQSSFKDFLGTLGLQLNSHFFGEKSKRVTWSLLPYTSLGENTKMRILEMALEHNHSYGVLHGFSHWDLMSLWTDHFDSDRHVICGYDVQFDKLVCAMNIIPGKKVWNADLICKDSSEEYKPYSLVAMAQMAACRELFWGNLSVDTVNLGVNVQHGEYKNKFNPDNAVLNGLPIYRENSTVQEIEGTFNVH